MCNIFSSVVADIAHDLIKQFPEDYDFKSMLARVGRDAGVDVKFEESGTSGSGTIGNTSQASDTLGNHNGACYNYKLQGLWTGVEEAYRQLVTALTEHGIRSLDTRMVLQPTSKKPTHQSQNQKPQSHKSERRTLRKKNVTTCLLSTARHAAGTEDRVNLGEDVGEDICVKGTNAQIHNSFTATHELAEMTQQIDEHQEPVAPLHGTVPSEVTLKHSPDLATEQNKGRSRKSAPKHVLPEASYNYSFLSKYRDQSYPSLGRTVRKRRAVVPALAEPTQPAVKKKRGRPQKCVDGTSEFSCSDCPFVTSRRSKLTEHVQRRHKGSPMGCDLCGKIFHNQTYMLRHRASHTGPQHCCDVCGKMFKIHKAMIKHRDTHQEGYTRPVFPCKMCTKTFCSQYIVDCHVRSFHLGQRKSYLCSYCGKKFTTKHSLQEHVNAHSGIKPHICEICGKGFSYDSALRDHKFTHGDEKQFKCDLCDKSFCQRSGLKMHMRIHKDNKQFQCQECGREFTQKQALQRHERVHKGVKPFMCKLCSRSFSDASIIRRHLTLVHQIHKDAKSWREDIVCMVQPDLEYHVSYIGKREVDPQPAKTRVNNSHMDSSTVLQTKARTGRNTKKNKLPLKESRTNANSHLPVHVQAVHVSAHTVSGRRADKLPSHHDDFQGITSSTDVQGTPPSQRNLLLTTEYLPQTHDPCYIEAPSQDPVLSLCSVTAAHSHSHSHNQPALPLASDLVQGQAYLNTGVVPLPSSIEESQEAPNFSTATTVQSTTRHGPFVQSHMDGEQQVRPAFHTVQHQHTSHTVLQQQQHTSVSLKEAPTAVSVCTTTATTTSIAAPQPLPSLYYYSQLASQFGMSLPDYPYMANTVFSGLGLSPSSPGLEHPSPSFPRPQTLGHLCAGLDPPSSILLRLQGQGQSTSDLSQGHSGRGDVHAVQDAYSGGHGLMLSSPVVESSRSGLLDSSADGLNMTTTLSTTTTSVPHKYTV